jgi:quinol monooxygenase YgiN
MYADNELIYPPYVTPRLRNARGEEWRELVDRVADSYRAMRGCLACAHQTLRRYKAPDSTLLDQYHLSLGEMLAHLQIEHVEHIMERAPSAKAA